jgi:hypothetical protein
MGYSRIRPELKMSWADTELRTIEGTPLNWEPKSEWVKSICFDGMESGLYVLTEDDDHYFTAHSIDLEFAEEIPVKETKMEKQFVVLFTGEMGKYVAPTYFENKAEAQIKFEQAQRALVDPSIVKLMKLTEV